MDLPGFADEMAEVAGTEEQHVEAGHGGDFLDVLERLGRFDLEDEEALGVAVLQVVRRAAPGRRLPSMFPPSIGLRPSG